MGTKLSSNLSDDVVHLHASEIYTEFHHRNAIFSPPVGLVEEVFCITTSCMERSPDLSEKSEEASFGHLP